MSRFSIDAAIRALASVPHRKLGYRPEDEPFGKRIADIPEAWWTPAIRRAAWLMLHEYREELARVFVPFDAIPEPPDVDPGALRDARDAARYIATDRSKVPDLEAGKKVALRSDGRLELRFAYNPHISAAINELPGRLYDGVNRCWHVPNEPQSVQKVVDFAQKHGFLVTMDAQDAMRPVLFKAKQYQAGPKVEKLDLPPMRRVPVVRRLDLIDGHFILRFPFERQLIDMLTRAVPGGRKSFVENKDTGDKFWKFKPDPVTAMALLSFAAQAKLQVTDVAQVYMDKVGREMDLRIEQSKADGAEFHVDGLGGTLRPFQVAGVRYLTRARRAICGDQPGLGKTCQGLAAVHHLKAYPVAVVCPAVGKENWEIEARRWLPGKVTLICDSKTPQMLIDTADIIIVNYDILIAEPVDKKKPRGKWRPVGLLERIMSREGGIQSVIIDESHRIKNSKARRSKACQLLAHGKEVILLLTGTAVLNNPKDLVHQLRVINRLNDLGGERGVTDRHTVVLNKALRGVCLVRRKKEDVLKELPPKVRTIVPVDIDNRKEYDKAERDLIAWMMDRYTDEEERAGKIDAALRAEILVKMAALTRLASQGKLAAIQKWIENFLESGEKLVMFAHHTDIVEAIARPYNAPIIYGDTKDRQGEKNRFQRCARCGANYDGHEADPRAKACPGFEKDMSTPLIALNLIAGSELITLTTASDVGFAEFPWHSAGSDQAEDRCHRMGQTDSVNSWWFVGKNTIDEDRVAVIESKRQMSSETLDGETIDLTEMKKKETSAQMEVLKRLRARGRELARG